jgi:hypothetical protein
MINIRKFLGLDYYTSQLDQFLAKLKRNQTHLSASQLAEKNKYQRISALRDTANSSDSPKKSFWDEF